MNGETEERREDRKRRAGRDGARRRERERGETSSALLEVWGSGNVAAEARRC